VLILGIESSCDDTGAAVVRDGRYVLSSIIASQDDIHGKYGGIVPELASRRHIETIIPVVEEALRRAGVTLDEIDAIGVTQGPGLVGSILVGLSFAKAAAYVKGIPFAGVNHLEAHILSAFLYNGDGRDTAGRSSEGDAAGRSANVKNTDGPSFPFVALIVSGGHTGLFLVRGFTDFATLGQTRDDAAGEAFDKVAKLLGLGYPGGVEIDRLAKQGDAASRKFRRPILARGSLEFSFSGLKTAVLGEVKSLGGERPGAAFVRDVSASFQEAVVDVLVKKAVWALEKTGAGGLVVAGGVACNSRLRQRLRETAGKEGFRLFIPPPLFCSDNGAMIAACAFHRLEKGESGAPDMNADPSLSVGSAGAA